MTPLGWLGRKTSTQTNQHVECEQHEWNSVCRRQIIQVCKKEFQDISWLFRAMWFAILFFTWQPALSLESEKKNIISSVEYPFLDLETALAMTFSFNPYAVFAWRTFNRVFKESLLFRKYNAQMLDIFHRAPSYGVVLVALECHLSSLHVLCLHRRYTALHQYFTN